MCAKLHLNVKKIAIYSTNQLENNEELFQRLQIYLLNSSDEFSVGKNSASHYRPIVIESQAPTRAKNRRRSEAR